MSAKIKNWLYVLLAVLLLGGSFFYYEFSSAQIHEESRKFLLEIYSKMARDYDSFVTRNWNILEDWGSYCNRAANEDDEEIIEKFIRASQKNWGFTEFYFLNDSGEYITLEGAGGTLQNADKFIELQNGEKYTSFFAKFPGREPEQFFSLPVIHGVYKEFPYTYVGISFDNSSLAEMLGISIYEDSQSYIAYMDGEVIVAMNPQGIEVVNVRDYMEHIEWMSDESRQNLQKATEEKHQTVICGMLDNKKNYIIYQPLSVEDGMIIGFIPQKSVNQNMRSIQRGAIIPLVGVFVLVALLLLYYMTEKHQNMLENKTRELEFRENILNIVTDPINDIYVIFSGNFEVEYVSPNIKRILGIDPERIKKNIYLLADAVQDHRQSLSWERIHSLAKGERWQSNRYLINQETQERKWYYEIIAHIQDETKDRFMLVLSDRTKEQQAMEQLRSALDSAKGANEAKSMFLANMSHEIRTPMNAIVGCADLLLKNIANEERASSYAKKIIMSSHILMGLLNDVLDMSRIESGKTCLNISPFSLAELVNEISMVIAPQAKAKQQNFKISVLGVEKEFLLGDKVRIEQILLNILSNAVKYTQTGGSIFLNITSPKQVDRKYQRLCFEVTDNGIGMTQEFLEAIFDPFIRIENTTTSGIKGTGLGMAITKNLVELMGGTISVKSQPGEGSTFIVYLDLQTQQTESEQVFWEEHKIRRMLVVDDEEDVCRNILKVMKDTGVEVTYVTTGEKALALLKEESTKPYDLLLIDWNMPEMDGVETAHRICALDIQERPILILAAFPWEEVGEKIKAAGIDGILVKPFFISELKECVKEFYISEKEKQGSAEQSIRGLHFLVVEDYELNYEILQERLEMEGATCEIAEDGEEGVEIFERSKPGHFDAILMDIQMPKMNGYEATRAIRAGKHPRGAGIPIIAMTANAFEEDKNKSLEAGMNAHVAKPIDMNLLKKVILSMRNETNMQDTED